MKVFKLNKKANNYKKGSLVTVGNFDGVHLGHQSLLKALFKLKSQYSLPIIVILFEPQPKEYFLKDKAPIRIDGLREKFFHLQNFGIDYVCCIHFNATMASLSPEEFVLDILVNKLSAQQILVGHDFQFGRDRSGQYQHLVEIGKTCGLGVQKMPAFMKNEQLVSSSKIRELLNEQDIVGASHLLGHDYSVIGRVIYGKSLARKWDVPTANIYLKRQNFALNGVFCVRIRICATNQLFYGVANVGKRPTVDGHTKVLEVHLFDFDASLYGQLIQVIFISRLRDEQRFDDLEALRLQILKDVAEAKAFFA